MVFYDSVHSIRSYSTVVPCFCVARQLGARLGKAVGVGVGGGRFALADVLAALKARGLGRLRFPFPSQRV